MIFAKLQLVLLSEYKTIWYYFNTHWTARYNIDAITAY